MKGEAVMRKSGVVISWTLAVLCAWGAMPVVSAQAGEALKYCRSAQVYRAWDEEGLEAFEKEAGVEVDYFIASSGVCVHRLLNDMADIASVTQSLSYRQKERGLVEVPFCRNGLAIVVKADCAVDGLTEEQLRRIFSKDIVNWKEVGGEDRPVTVVVPGTDTAAYANFDRMVMHREEIRYDIMTYQSTRVIDVVKRCADCVSFIAHAAIMGDDDVKALKIDGRSPLEQDYPYFQIFSFVTKGEPAGAAKTLVDFIRSPAGLAIMEKRGMLPPP